MATNVSLKGAEGPIQGNVSKGAFGPFASRQQPVCLILLVIMSLIIPGLGKRESSITIWSCDHRDQVSNINLYQEIVTFKLKGSILRYTLLTCSRFLESLYHGSTMPKIWEWSEKNFKILNLQKGYKLRYTPDIPNVWI